MTPKQTAFVREYLIDRNATQAAIRAGYSARYAAEMGYKLVHNNTVSAGIAAAEARLQMRADMTVERVAAMLLEDREMARKLGQPSAAVSAAMGVAKLYGLIVDKTQNENRNVNADELDDAVLSHIATGSGGGVAKTARSEEEPSIVH